ncbi:hypothetical protein MW887_005825 [Aspergillus wentii]|nr:hypothetical protein MW887_005825 [Aspergillus wentii]
MVTASSQPIWGYRWRSSPVFIVSAMAMALFTDTFLYTFLVPILPYVLESRIGLDVSLTQKLSFALLSESAGISVLLSTPVGHLADKLGSKRGLLLWALVIALGSTLCIALSMSTFALFAGRLVQAVASTIIWVVGFSTIADNVQQEHMGKTYGAISVAVSAGTSAGPMVSGILFQVGGYWLAWSSAFLILLIDIVLRLLMLERPREKNESGQNSDSEEDPLLPQTGLAEEKTGWSFYACLFSQRRFLGGALCYVMFAILVSSFDATLPLHVRDAFNWGSMPAGLMFVALQAPGMVLAPFIGWLKDRVGTRDPTTLGFATLAPLVWLGGIPGDDRFPWANEGDRGRVIYAIAMTGIGIMMVFLNGAGTMEATLTVGDLEAKHPGIFGPNGGYSRALSISSMGWTLGTFFGPIIAGMLVDQVGYYEMSSVLAGMCALFAVVSFTCLTSTWRVNRGQDVLDRS